MEMYNRAATMILRHLCRLFLRPFAKTLPFSASLLKALNMIELAHDPPGSPLMDASIAGPELPELPVDILVEILGLLEITDLVRAGSVCSSWKAAYTSLRSLGIYRRPQTPCLLYTSESDGDNVACLHSLAEKRVYKLTLPEPPIRNRTLIGSSNGWLITADERSELHITNPITGDQIALPSVTTIEQVKPIFDDAGAIQKYEFSNYFGEEVMKEPSIHSLDNLRDRLYVKASVFYDPSTKSYIVVLIHNPICQLSFTRVGDSEWTWLPPSADYEDCIYIDGVLYAVTATAGIDAFDLSGPTVSRKVIIADMKDYMYERVYIVQTPSGDVLQVWRGQTISGRDVEAETSEIMVYKVDMAAKELVQINSLKDHVLFLGHNQTSCLTAEEYPHLKANHVYLTDNAKFIAFSKSNRRDIGVFSLGDGSTEEIVPPQLWCTWPAPIWITPNLANMSLGLNDMYLL